MSHAAGPSAPLYCDLTQSWSARGGGVGTYIRHKRRHLLDSGVGSHLLIIPGERDDTLVEADGRAITVTIASPRVPGSPNYRLLLRNGAVRAALARYRPELIECQDAYNLPWAAIAYRNSHPTTALVAAYCTDFPTAYVKRPLGNVVGQRAAAAAANLAYRYAARLYRKFDATFAMSEHGGAQTLRAFGVPEVEIVPLGVELGQFNPALRSQALRASIGVGEGEPLIIYAGRLDKEKRASVVVDAFCALPAAMNATLVLVGDGPLRGQFAQRLAGRRAHLAGFVDSRADVARWLASADIYASAMADETFGISVIEAQASGLPIVGVAAGAMIDRISAETGLLGPVDDSDTMARNIAALWAADHHAIGQAGRRHAQQFSWDATMAALFDDLYPRAIARAAHRSKRVPHGAMAGAVA